MFNTVAQQLASIDDASSRETFRYIINALADRMSSQLMGPAPVLALATTTTKIKTTNTCSLVANGVFVTVAAADNLITLTTANNISANKYNVICIYVDSAGVITTGMGTEGATAAAVKFPTPPVGKAMIGGLMCTNGASVFTGGGTALTGGTFVGTFFDTIGACDPSIIIG